MSTNTLFKYVKVDQCFSARLSPNSPSLRCKKINDQQAVVFNNDVSEILSFDQEQVVYHTALVRIKSCRWNDATPKELALVGFVGTLYHDCCGLPEFCIEFPNKISLVRFNYEIL